MQDQQFEADLPSLWNEISNDLNWNDARNGSLYLEVNLMGSIFNTYAQKAYSGPSILILKFIFFLQKTYKQIESKICFLT